VGNAFLPSLLPDLMGRFTVEEGKEKEAKKKGKNRAENTTK